MAMTDHGHTYDYPPAVRLQINDDKIDDYVRAADFLNTRRFDVVSLQHEFGIFGGEAGGDIMALLSRLTCRSSRRFTPFCPSRRRCNAASCDQIIDASSRVVVMAEKGRELLRTVYRRAGAKRSRSSRTAFPTSRLSNRTTPRRNSASAARPSF